MAIANLLFALILAGQPEPEPAAVAPGSSPAPATTPAPASGPSQQPVFGPSPQPQPQPQPAPQPAPAPVQPAPAQPAPVYEAPPSGPVALEPQHTGLGMLVAGPITAAAGIPLSLLGNLAWRDNCGPYSSNRECADGTFASVAAHTLAGLAYGGGIGMTAAGASRRGRFDAGQDPTRTGTGFIVGGAVLLPSALIGMGMARLFFWLPTPECMTYSCVKRYQSYSSLTVGGLALVASAGAGLLMYGASYNRSKPRYSASVALLPQLGRGFSGLSLTGQF